jgi:hypothetical protein
VHELATRKSEISESELPALRRKLLTCLISSSKMYRTRLAKKPNAISISHSVFYTRSARLYRRAVGTHYGPTRTNGRLQATPSEGRRSRHYDTLSSLQLPPGRTDHRKTTSRAEMLEDGLRQRYRRSRLGDGLDLVLWTLAT